MLGIIWKEIFHFKFFKIFFFFCGEYFENCIDHTVISLHSLCKQFAQRVCTKSLYNSYKTHMNSAMLPIAMYLLCLILVGIFNW